MADLWQHTSFSPVWPRPLLAHHLETLLLPSADLQDQAKDNAKKDKDLNNFPDLTERSGIGRAVKVSSLVKLIY